MEPNIKFDPSILAACGDYKQYGFTPRRYRKRNGLMLVIDDNFKLFCIPNPGSMDWILLGPRNKIVAAGFILGHDNRRFHKAIQEAADSMSRIGTMFTYGSINLTGATGVSRVN